MDAREYCDPFNTAPRARDFTVYNAADKIVTCIQAVDLIDAWRKFFAPRPMKTRTGGYYIVKGAPPRR